MALARSLVLAITFVFLFVSTASIATAASYQTRGGSIVDPILTTTSGIHPYVGVDLEPSVSIFVDNLDDAYLFDADLSGASMFLTTLIGADLSPDRGQIARESGRLATPLLGWVLRNAASFAYAPDYDLGGALERRLERIASESPDGMFQGLLKERIRRRTGCRSSRSSIR
jgi:hypothetical protein